MDNGHCVMSEGRKIATRAIQISARRPIEIECVVKPSRGFPDNSTCTIVRVRNRFIETQSLRRDLTDRPLGLSAIQANSVLPREGDGCPCVARQSLPHLLPSSFLRSVPLPAIRPRQLGKKKWMDHFVPLLLEIRSFFFSAHRRRVNRTPRCILPTFRRHFVNVPRMSTASRSCLRRFADDSWTRTKKGTEKEREIVWFRFYIPHEYAAARFSPS